MAKTIHTVSVYKKESPKSFPHEKRLNPFAPSHEDEPGPGNYVAPSEFGIYTSKM